MTGKKDKNSQSESDLKSTSETVILKQKNADMDCYFEPS